MSSSKNIEKVSGVHNGEPVPWACMLLLAYKLLDWMLFSRISQTYLFQHLRQPA